MTAHDDLFKRARRLVPYYRGRIGWITSRVVILTVIVSALVLAFSPKYVARTKLTLLPTRSEIGYAAQRPETWGASPASVLGQTHAEALMSRSLAEEVARTMQGSAPADIDSGGILGGLRRWIVAPLTGGFHHMVTLLNTGRWKAPESDPVLAMAQTIQSRTQVRNLPGSFVFEVAVTWDDPATAARILNLLTERYIKMTKDTSQEEMRTTREFIEARVKEVETGLGVLQARIKDYRATEKVFSTAYNTSADVDLGLQELSQSERALSAARVDWQQLNTRIEALKAYQTPAALAAVEAERSGLKARQEALEKVIAEQIAKLDKMPAKEAGLLDLYRERMIQERALTGLQDRLLETKVSEAVQLSAVRVIDPAIAPLYPERPLVLRNTAAAVLVGLLLSISFVLLSEGLRAGIRCREDLGNQSHAMLGLVPFKAAVNADPESEKGGKMAEFFRSVAHGAYGTASHHRTVNRHLDDLLLLLADDGAARVNLIVSLNGGEGKTFLIEQLARRAEQGGRKVLVVDAKLSNPGLHTVFGKPPAPGLSEVLAGSAKVQDVIQPVSASVDLIGAGTVAGSGLARWRLAACRTQLSQLAGDYDLVLIDSMALRQDAAVSRLLPLAHRVICVFDATASARDDLPAVRDFLRGFPGPTAFVLNKVLYKADYLFGPGEPQDRTAVAPSNALTWPTDDRKSCDAGDSRRAFVRYPSTLPLICGNGDAAADPDQELRNISYGGISFIGQRRLEPGKSLVIRFPLLENARELKGEVMWCRDASEGDRKVSVHGVRFKDEPEAVVIGLVEQIRQIEDYRQAEQRRTGRSLSAIEATEEWKGLVTGQSVS